MNSWLGSLRNWDYESCVGCMDCKCSHLLGSGMAIPLGVNMTSKSQHYGNNTNDSKILIDKA